MDDVREQVSWARVAQFPFSLSSTDFENGEALPCAGASRRVSLE
jgi:hypothetical protein